MTIDYEYELSNGWGKWENLVLTFMKESAENQKGIRDELNRVGLDIALISNRTRIVENHLLKMDDKVEGLEDREEFLRGSWKAISIIGGIVLGLVAIGGLVLGLVGGVI